MNVTNSARKVSHGARKVSHGARKVCSRKVHLSREWLPTPSLPRGDLARTILTIQLKQARVFAVKDLTLGSVVVGSAMFARGSGLTQWDKAIARPKEQVDMGLLEISMEDMGLL